MYQGCFGGVTSPLNRPPGTKSGGAGPHVSPARSASAAPPATWILERRPEAPDHVAAQRFSPLLDLHIFGERLSERQKIGPIAGKRTRERNRDHAVVVYAEPGPKSVDITDAESLSVEQDRRRVVLDVGGCRRLRRELRSLQGIGTRDLGLDDSSLCPNPYSLLSRCPGPVSVERQRYIDICA